MHNLIELAVILETAAKALRQCHDAMNKAPGLERTKLHRADISVRARKILARMGIEYIEDVANLSEEDIRDQKNCGATTVHEIRKCLAKRGLDIKNPSCELK